MGLPVFFASSSASRPHGYQSTGLPACCCRYGLVSLASRFIGTSWFAWAARIRRMSVPVLKLKRGEDRRLRAGHLWIFSNEVDTVATPLTQFEPGTVVQVHSDRDQFLGFAYVNPRTLIAARIVTRDAAYPLDRSLLVHRLRVALALRE